MIRSLILVSALLATPASAGNQHDWDCPGGAKLHVGVIKKFDEKKQEDEPRYYLSIDAARNGAGQARLSEREQATLFGPGGAIHGPA
jgi:hypothetical protein